MKSWRTTLIGLVCMAVGLWSAHVTYVPTQSLYFNVIYVWTGPIALVLVGIGLVHAADHKSVS